MPNDIVRNNATRPLEADETLNLISSEKVDGTAIYNRKGDHLGAVHHLMIDKSAGRVQYAVVSFGGFLGIGESYHPLPWSALTFDPNMGGYVLDTDRDALERAPHYMANSAPDWSDRPYRARVDQFWSRSV